MAKEVIEVGTVEAGKILGVTANRIGFLVRHGRIKAKSISNRYVINVDELKKFRYLKPGRPNKLEINS